MQTIQLPTVEVDPAIAPLITEQIEEIRDVVLDKACKVAQNLNVTVKHILIREYFEPYEDDFAGFVFDVNVSTDDDTVHEYWGDLLEAVWNEKGRLSKESQSALDHVSVFVKW